MSNPTYITRTSTGTMGPVNLDYRQSPFNASVGLTVSTSSGTVTYGVQYTLDDQQYLTNIGSTRALVWIDDVNLPTGTSSFNQTTNDMFPVAAVRCVVSAISSCTAAFCVIQGGPG